MDEEAEFLSLSPCSKLLGNDPLAFRQTLVISADYGHEPRCGDGDLPIEDIVLELALDIRDARRTFFNLVGDLILEIIGIEVSGPVKVMAQP